MSPIADIFRRLSRPTAPLPTGESPKLSPFDGIHAVLFDIYGTLVISGSGEIGTTGAVNRPGAFAAAVEASGLPAATCPAEHVIEMFLVTIEEHHRRARETGIEHPEVDILEVWSDVWEQLLALGSVATPVANIDFARLSVEFEARANPVWPMPGVEACLASLRRRSIRMGLISNAQFFTPDLFPALIDETLDDLGFDRQLRYYSYEHRHAKPSPYMYRLAAETLAERGVSPEEVVYVGNDLRNDVLPAAAVGFRTVLFAGDRRSLRWRAGDPLVEGVEPDAVVTELMQVSDLCRA